MRRAEATTPEGIRLAAQLDIAVERNAHLLVALRHAIHELHLEQEGHDHASRWPLCRHPRCQSVAVLVGEPNGSP